MNAKRTCPLLLVAIVQVLCCADLASAENWPAWRGPQRSGVTTDRGVPLTWSPTSGVRWKTPLPGVGVSNPVVWNNRVVVTSSAGSRHDELHVVCLGFDSGKILWDRRFWGTAPTLYHPTKSSMATPSPATDGEQIYVFFGTGDVMCIDFDGRLLWHRSLASEYGVFENRFAASSSPLLVGDTVILQCDHYGASYLLAIDKHSGSNRWKTDRPGTWLSWSSPQLISVAGTSGVAGADGVPGTDEAQLIVCGSERIDAYRPSSGKRLWTLPGLTRECIPTPVVASGLLIATSGPRGTSYAVRPGTASVLPKVVWTNRQGTPFVPSGIVVGENYFLVDDRGIATCIDARSGALRWRKRLGGNFTASPVAAEGRVYFVNEAGTTVVIDGRAVTYQELARNELGESVYASPAISAGRILLRTPENLWCIGVAGGSASSR